MTFLEVTDISLSEGRERVVDNVSFSQQQFEKLAISGESGAGKSSLLKLIGGLAQAEEGYVLFDGKKVKGPYERLIAGEPGVAYLSQHYELRNKYRVEEILEYANELPEEEAARLFDVCQISHLLKRWTSDLSGGEKQRIALTRLLIGSPKLLLLDEPFSNLDLDHKQILKKVIEDIGEKLNITSILVSHDPDDTLSWADKILVMKTGKIIQQGTPREIYRSPVNAYTAGLFGKFNLMDEQLLALFQNTGERESSELTGQKVLKPADQRILKEILPDEKTGTLFFRPEDFIVSHSEENGVPATIERIFYLGNGLEIELVTGGCLLTVRTNDGSFQKGERVYVSLQRNSG